MVAISSVTNRRMSLGTQEENAAADCATVSHLQPIREHRKTKWGSDLDSIHRIEQKYENIGKNQKVFLG